MKKISFRGKGIHSIGWAYGWLVMELDGTAWISRYYHKGEWEQIDPETVGQFTGLRDKNNVKIYEGDVLRIEGCYFRKAIQKNKVVKYDAKRAWFGVLDASHTDSLDDFDCENDVEVIGNIHEIPELLMATK